MSVIKEHESRRPMPRQVTNNPSLGPRIERSALVGGQGIRHKAVLLQDGRVCIVSRTNSFHMFSQANIARHLLSQPLPKRAIPGAQMHSRQVIFERKVETSHWHDSDDPDIPTSEPSMVCEVQRQLSGAHETQALESTVMEVPAPVPPVMRLHTDILADILEIGLAMDDDSWDTHSWFERDKRGRIPFALSASHVNRCWRNTAIGETRIWGNLKISASQCVSYLDMFLARSGTSPLDIRVRGGKSWEGVQRRLHPLAERWRVFSGSSFCAFDIDNMISSLRNLSTPNLEDLRIMSFDHDMRIRRGDDNVTILEGGAPKLLSLYLLDVSIKACLPPLTSLKTLDLYMFRPGAPLDLEEFREFVTASPTLSHLKVASSALGSINGRHDLSPIPLPSLRSLEVSFDINCCPDRLICIFVALSAPQLESLVIDQSPSPNTERLMGAILSLRSASDYPALRTLMLWDVHCAKWIGPKFIRIVPAVSDLTVVRSAEDVVLRTLVEKDDDPAAPLWPKLRTLKLSVFDVELLCELVLHRIEARRPIQAVTIVHDSYVSQFAQDRIDWLRERVDLCEIYPPQ